MIWLAWRLQRLGLGLSAGLLALLAAYMQVTGAGIHALYPHLNRACATAGGDGLACSRLAQAVDDWSWPYRTLFTWLQLVPLGFALLAAVPLILQLEQGTFRLVWTQSATRERWIAAMLGSALLATAVASAGFALLTSWWLQPLDAVQGRLLPGRFELEGVVPIAYGVFALALVVAAGTLLRRSAAALGVALAGFLVAHVTIAGWVRPQYLPPARVAWRIGVPDYRRLFYNDDWLIASGISDGRGPIHAQESVTLICPPTFHGELQILTACLQQHHWTHNTLIYQPSARFWPFQIIESAIYAGMAALLLMVAIGRIRARPTQSRLASCVLSRTKLLAVIEPLLHWPTRRHVGFVRIPPHRVRHSLARTARRGRRTPCCVQVLFVRDPGVPTHSRGPPQARESTGSATSPPVESVMVGAMDQ